MRPIMNVSRYFKQPALIFLLLIFVGNLQFLQAQQVQIEGEFVNCAEDSLFFYVLDGLNLNRVKKIPLENNEGTYSFGLTINEPPEGLYLLGDRQASNAKTFILGANEASLKLTGNCDQLANASIWQSKLNKDYNKTQIKIDQLRRSLSRLIGKYRMAKRQGGDVAAVIAEMGKLDEQKIQLLDSLKKASPMLAKFVGPNTYLSFENHGEAYDNESVYFAETYFKYTDLGDQTYSRIPVLQNAFRMYAATLARLGFSGQEQYNYINQWLNKISAPSARSAAMVGAINGLKGNNEDAYAKLAESYLEAYAPLNAYVSQQVEQELNAIKAQLIGAVAPDILLPTPEGDSLGLHDLRGKYVLVDFWASWCGPCRKENPNVVKLYQKYKDKGFEILGVSLDRDRNRWLQAIEQDQLEWLHISDLKQWRSVAAQTYGIHAIPFTILVDPEGKIIAKRLRGLQLQRKLEEIFGNTEG